MIPTLLICLAHQTPGTINLNVDGRQRQAIIFQPTVPSGRPPVVFVFHGRSGSSSEAASFKVQEAWPEAFVVCPQGLPTYRAGDTVHGYAGWQTELYQANEVNYDVRFFDLLLKKVQTDYHLNQVKVFAMGYSNGGQFTYVLWKLRGNRFAGLGVVEGNGADYFKPQVPLPFFMTTGDVDTIIPSNLQHDSLETALRLNEAGRSAKPYDGQGKLYGGKKATLFWPYHGDHWFPFACVPTMVKFFKDFGDKA